MKKIIFAIIAILSITMWVFLQKGSNNLVDNKINSNFKNKNPQEEETFIFVPYWTFNDSLEVEDYDSVIYFGLTINNDGIDRSEEGYAKLNSFVKLIPEGKKKYLTLRIIGEVANDEILDNASLQRKIAEQISQIAVESKFDGVVVDFETSAFGFSSKEEKITNLYKNLNKEIKNSNLELISTVFGDTYYRGRPYNITEISNLSDKLIIMSYDFHKARLNPGPNFPFSDKALYGYDFKTMINDFSRDTSYEKIVVALGYFGYDWKLGEDGVSVGLAEPLSLGEIESRFINSCGFKNCKKTINKDYESVVKYEDSDGFSHEVWFEDSNSAEKKIEFLNSIGINQIASWAYSYY